MVTIVDDAPAEKAAAFGVQGVSMLVQPSRSELMELARLVDAGKLGPIVRGVFPLSRAKEAYQKGLAGHNRGKLVLSVSN